MKVTQDSTIHLNFIDSSIPVNVFQLSPQLPSTLDIQRLLHIANMPKLLTKATSHSCIAILYRTDQSSAEILSCFDHLLSTGLGQPSMLEFSSPQDPDEVYVLAHYSDKLGLGQFLQHQQIGLFQFHLETVLSPEDVEKYIEDLQATRLALFTQIQQYTQSTLKFQQETAALEAATLCNRSLREKLSVAKAAVEVLQNQVMNQQAKLTVMERWPKVCEVCRVHEKNVAGFPCGHLVSCVYCAESSSRLVCRQCQTPVSELIPIHYPS